MSAERDSPKMNFALSVDPFGTDALSRSTKSLGKGVLAEHNGQFSNTPQRSRPLQELNIGAGNGASQGPSPFGPRRQPTMAQRSPSAPRHPVEVLAHDLQQMLHLQSRTPKPTEYGRPALMSDVGLVGSNGARRLLATGNVGRNRQLLFNGLNDESFSSDSTLSMTGRPENGFANPRESLMIEPLLGNSWDDLNDSDAFASMPGLEKFFRGDIPAYNHDQEIRDAVVEHDEAGVWQWRGTMPQQDRDVRLQQYSTKIFIGGVPWAITADDLLATFLPYGAVRVEWPRSRSKPTRGGFYPRNCYAAADRLSMKENFPSVEYFHLLGTNGSFDEKESEDKHRKGSDQVDTGFAYVIFQTGDDVQRLLLACKRVFRDAGFQFYFDVPRSYMGFKEVQVIPWALTDTFFVLRGKVTTSSSQVKETIYVGGLHGRMTAEALATVMNDVFGGVACAWIDIDSDRYPVGTGRVAFDDRASYLKAVSAFLVHITSNKYSKTIQIDPYVMDSPCGECKFTLGKFFCRDPACFGYYCHRCWRSRHGSNPAWIQHMPTCKRNSDKADLLRSMAKPPLIRDHNESSQ